MGSSKPGFAELAQAATTLQPEEKQARVARKKSHLFIGMPAEASPHENRVALSPASVRTLVNNDHTVVIQAGAGHRSHFSDREYADAGARISHDVEKVYEADIIVKVAACNEEEVERLHDKQTLITTLQLPILKEDLVRKLVQKRVTAFAFEYFKDDSGTFPFVRSMSEIAGSSAVLIAAELLTDDTHGRGMLLGGITGIPPTRVLILGAGVVGEFAARAALGLGAQVKVFDDNVYKLLRLQNNIGSRLYTSTIDPETLAEDLRFADVAIGAIHSESGRTPVVVNEEMVANMKAGSVVVDVSIDQGGCFETSEVTTPEQPTFKKYDVIHYGVANIPSRVSKTASRAISNIVTYSLLRSAQMGGLDELIRNDAGARHGVYLYNGFLTNKYLSRRFNIKYTELELLLTSDM